MKVVDLKAALKARGLDTSGLKAALEGRLAEAELADAKKELSFGGEASPPAAPAAPAPPADATSIQESVAPDAAPDASPDPAPATESATELAPPGTDPAAAAESRRLEAWGGLHSSNVGGARHDRSRRLEVWASLHSSNTGGAQTPPSLSSELRHRYFSVAHPPWLASRLLARCATEKS